jgi:hypothetical protein
MAQRFTVTVDPEQIRQFETDYAGYQRRLYDEIFRTLGLHEEDMTSERPPEPEQRQKVGLWYSPSVDEIHVHYGPRVLFDETGRPANVAPDAPGRWETMGDALDHFKHVDDVFARMEP